MQRIGNEHPKIKYSHQCSEVLQFESPFKKLIKAEKMAAMFRTSSYEGESIIIRNVVAFMFLLAAQSFSRASLGVVFFLSQQCRFQVARSVPLSQP